MKKVLSVIWAAALIFALAGCGIQNPSDPHGYENISTKEPETETEAPSESESESESETETEAPLLPSYEEVPGPMLPDGTVETDALSYCLIDEEGQLVLTKNAVQHVKPTDLSKIMTALLVLENEELSDTVTVSESAARSIVLRTNRASEALSAGETLTVEDLLNLMIADRSDAAANALAEHDAKNVFRFAEKMNAKAKELGMYHTNFTNPSGIDENGQYSCAYDMALLMKAACENPKLSALLGFTEYTVPATAFSAPREISHTNRILSEDLADGTYFASMNGWTKGGKGALTAAAERDGKTVYGAVMYSDEGIHWFDCRNLYEYAYSVLQNTDPVPYGYVYDVTLSEDSRPVLTFRNATGAEVSQVAYWSEGLGTEKAQFIYNPKSGDELVLDFNHVGLYHIQIACKRADGTTCYQGYRTLYRGGHNVNGAINKIGPDCYYISEAGFLETGFIEMADGVLYSDSEGRVFFDRILEDGGNRYYVNSDGYIVTGWQVIDEKQFYFRTDGTMVTGKITIGNRSYEFDEDGVLISE